ncbi:MAG: SDR family oxidoreductase [Thermoplasmata archaeon]
MTEEPPRLLLVGGAGGLVGRSVLPEFLPHYRIRSIHRHSVLGEQLATRVDWVAADVADPATDWTKLLVGVDVVMTLAWYRWERPAVFAGLTGGLLRLLEAARSCRVPRFLHVSVPEAPAEMETTLPYFIEKRRFDRALAESGLSYRILRPTMLYAPGDRLLGVMLRMMRRYRIFPMFGDGRYHVSPIAAEDLAHALRLEADRSGSGTSDLGGPTRFAYRELTDLMFRALGRHPRYLTVSQATARRLTGLLVAAGSTVLYPYEVDWLMSDRLGLPAYGGLDRPLRGVGPYLARQAAVGPHRRPGAQA